MSVTQGQVNFAISPLFNYLVTFPVPLVNGKKFKAPFMDENHTKHSQTLGNR